MSATNTLGAKLRAVAGVETPRESFAGLVQALTVAGLTCARHDDKLEHASGAEQKDFSVEAACEEASRILTKDVKVRELTPEEASWESAAFVRRSIETAAKRRFDLTLFTPNSEK